MNDSIKSKVQPLIEKTIQDLGYQLVDIRTHKEAEYEGTTALDIVIDKDGGVNINDCVAVSRAISPILDEHDPIQGSYVLEVSSKGVEVD